MFGSCSTGIVFGRCFGQLLWWLKQPKNNRFGSDSFQRTKSVVRFSSRRDLQRKGFTELPVCHLLSSSHILWGKNGVSPLTGRFAARKNLVHHVRALRDKAVAYTSRWRTYATSLQCVVLSEKWQVKRIEKRIALLHDPETPVSGGCTRLCRMWRRQGMQVCNYGTAP